VNSEEQERISRRTKALVRKIGEACDELERLAEENPELVGRITYGAEEHKEAYLRLKARLALADSAPRCRWVRQDGTTCGSPQMKRHIYCFAHRQMAEAQALMLQLPALEDANAIQVGLMRIQKALIEGTISTKTAGLLLYSMQLALQNVGRTTFGQVKAQELVTETVDGEEALSQEIGTSGHRDIGSSENQKQHQMPFTTEGTEDADEGKTLPLVNADRTPEHATAARSGDPADDTDKQKLDEEFVSMPGGYGFTRVRLKIEPERPELRAPLPQRTNTGLVGDPAAVPQEHRVAQTYANQG
jgi:hypothetical protein